MTATELLPCRIKFRFTRSVFIVDARNGFEDVKEDVDWGFTFFLPELKKIGCKIWGFILPEVSEIEGEIDLWTKD